MRLSLHWNSYEADFAGKGDNRHYINPYFFKNKFSIAIQRENLF